MSEFDNPILRVNGSGQKRLKEVMDLAPSWLAIGWCAEKTDLKPWRLVFFRPHTDSEKMTAFPSPIDTDLMASIANNWLMSARYPYQPDIDGDIKKGWLAYTGDYGDVSPYGYPAFLAVEPHWLIQGK